MQTLIQWLLYAIVRLFLATYRVEQIQTHYRPDPQDAHERKRALAIWHEQLFMKLGIGKSMSMVTMASRSKEGRIIGWVLDKLGFITVYGSGRRNGKDKGGSSALKQMVSKVKAGRIAAITVDGSIGPRREVKQGVALVAMMTDCDVVPVAAVADRYWEFNTWDKLKLPKPFARITVCFGHPITVPAGTTGDELQTYLKRIGQGINTCEVRALIANPATGVHTRSTIGDTAEHIVR